MDKPLAQALLQDMPDEKPDIRHVLTMQEDEIDNLTYAVLTKEEEDVGNEEGDEQGEESKPSTTSKGKTMPPPNRTQQIPLHRSYKRLIKVIIAYNEYRQIKNSPIMDDWSNVNPEDFNNFRMHEYYIFIKTPRPSRLISPDPVSSAAMPSSTSLRLNKAEQFKKGMK